MKAVVLVGGFGTRLRPLTLGIPKQMLPVAGATMLERVVSRLGDHGVDEVVLSLGYRPEVFTEAFPDGSSHGVELTYAVEPEPYDTAGAIAFAADSAGLHERFLALNGDVLTDLDLEALIDRHDRSGAGATIALTPVEDPSRYGVVAVDPRDRVEAFVEKPEPGTAPSNWINAGTYVLEPSVLDLVPRGRKVSIEREVFPVLAGRGELYAQRSEVYWIDAGTPEAYLHANLDYLDGRRDLLGAPAEVVGVDRSAQIASDAKVTRSVVGRGCVVGPGASVVDSVLHDGVRVQAGATVKGSMVGSGAMVGEAASIADLSVVGSDVDVPAGTTMVAERLPGPQDWPAS
ncbi:MAG: sugar phosphate nucleotidyltransferase [Microthrixaceae bacterium]